MYDYCVTFSITYFNYYRSYFENDAIFLFFRGNWYSKAFTKWSKFQLPVISRRFIKYKAHIGVDSRGAGGARALPKWGGSKKGQSLISAYQSLPITASTSGFEKLSMVLFY